MPPSQEYTKQAIVFTEFCCINMCTISDAAMAQPRTFDTSKVALEPQWQPPQGAEMLGRMSKQLLSASVFAMLITDQTLLRSVVAAAGAKLSLTCSLC